MSIEQIRSHFGFSRMPFGKDLAPSMLHRHRSHQEALARISFLVQEQAIGVLTGEVGSGKTVAARAAMSELESSRHSIIYLANPAMGARGIYAEIVARLGGEPRFFKSALITQAGDLLAKEATERGRQVVVIVPARAPRTLPDLDPHGGRQDRHPQGHPRPTCPLPDLVPQLTPTPPTRFRPRSPLPQGVRSRQPATPALITPLPGGHLATHHLCMCGKPG